MISKQIIHDYISRIENEISDNNNTSNENNGVQYCGMLYGIRIAEGKKQYPINDTGIWITDEFKKGLIKGLRRVLWCTQKKEQLVKKRYDDADEALIASFFESECIPNCIERLKNKLHSANIDKGDTMRTKEDILTEINKTKREINSGCSIKDAAYHTGTIDGMYYVIEGENTDLKDDNVVTVNIKYELDKAAYKQYVADMNEIEAEFKADSHIEVAGEKLEYGDVVYKKSDGKMYKVDDSHRVVSTSYEGSTDELIKQLGYTVHATRDGKSLKFERIEHVDNEQKETIPATLKDVCEWWIKEYPEDIYIDKTGDIGVVRDHMEYILEKQNGK